MQYLIGAATGFPARGAHSEVGQRRLPGLEQQQGLAHRGGDLGFDARHAHFLLGLQGDFHQLLQPGAGSYPAPHGGITVQGDFHPVFESG